MATLAVELRPAMTLLLIAGTLLAFKEPVKFP